MAAFRPRRPHHLRFVAAVAFVAAAFAAAASAAAADPTNTAVPSVAGTAETGSTLSGSPGSWSGTNPISYGYQWQHCTSYQSTVSADGPVADWHLDETTGARAEDATANAYDGSFSGSSTLGASGALTDPVNTAVDFAA